MLSYVFLLFVAVALTLTWSRKGFESVLPLFCFILVFSPIEAQLRIPGLFNLTAQRLSIVLLVIFFILNQRKNPGAGKGLLGVIKVLIVLHVMWSFIVVVNSVLPGTSLKRVVSQVIEYYAIFFILMRSLKSMEIAHKMLFGAFGAVALSCFFGVFEAYSNFAIVDWFPQMDHRFGYGLDLARGFRIRSTFQHAILFGAGIATAIPIGFYLLLQKPRLRRSLFIWSGLLMMFLCIYKTMSRGPWLGLILSVIVLALLWKRARGPALKVACLAGLVMFLRPGVFETIKNLYLGTFNTDSPLGTSYEYRYALLDVAREAVGGSPGTTLWGFGQGTFFSLGLEGTFLGTAHQFLSCDSAWIEAMVETGYVGALLLVGVLGAGLVMAWSGYRRSQLPEKALFALVLANQIGFYFMMSNVALYGWGQNGHFLWLLIGVAAAIYRLAIASEATEESGAGGPVAAAQATAPSAP